MPKPVFAALAACLLLLTGCGTDRHMADQITDLNKAQQRATIQVMLLNVLRARAKEPLAYSHLDVLRGGLSAEAGIAFTLPFGNNNGGGRSAAPFLSLGPGVSQDLTPHDDQDFYRGILTPVTPETWALYQDQNWPPELLFHLFVEDFKIQDSSYDRMLDDIRTACSVNGGVEEVASHCRLRDSLEKQISEIPTCAPIVHVLSGQRTYEFSNDPGRHCNQMQFESFMHGLLILGFHISKQDDNLPLGPVFNRANPSSTMDWPFKLKDSDIKIVKVQGGFQVVEVKSSYLVHLVNLPCPGSANIAIAAQSEVGAAVRSGETAAAAQCKDGPGGLNIAITTRSPDGMIYYLGEVARALLPLDPGKTPMPVTVRSGSGAEHPLMLIETGDDDDAVASVDFEGETYSIRQGTGDLTLQTFELLQQIFALYNKAPSAPATTAVTVVP